MQKCSICKNFKTVDNFRYRSGNRSHQLRTVCKECEAEKQRVRMQDPSRKAYAALKQKDNKVKRARDTKRYRERHPQKAKEQAKRNNYKAVKRWREKGGPGVEREKECALKS